MGENWPNRNVIDNKCNFFRAYFSWDQNVIGGSKTTIALMMTVTPTDEVDGGGLCINSVI